MDVRVVRARTPPALWQWAPEDADGLPNIAEARTNRGLSTASYLANVKQEKLGAQIERQRTNPQKTKDKRPRAQLQDVAPRSPSSPSLGSTFNPDGTSRRQTSSSPLTLVSVGGSMEAHVEFFHKEKARKRREQREEELRLQRIRDEESNQDVDGPAFQLRLEQETEEIHKKTEAIERRIKDMTKKIRMEKLNSADGSGLREEEAQARRVEEQRQKEAAIKRARKKEQMARDPHRKIAIKLENKKSFGADAAIDAIVPMQTLDFIGSKGREQVSMVDVTVLRSRCMGLEQGASVENLMESQVKADRRKTLMQVSRTMANQVLERCASAPEFRQRASLLGSSASGLEPLEPLVLVGDDKLRNAYTRRQANNHNEFLHRLFMMRSEMPGSVIDRFGVVDQKRLHDNDDDDEEYTLEELTRAQIGKSFMASRQSISDAGLSFKEAPEHRLNRRTGKRGGILDFGKDLAEIVAAHKRARKYWACIRAAACWIGVQYNVKRQHQAIAAIQSFLLNAGEWTRIKSAVSMFVQRIKRVQKCFRDFRQMKAGHISDLETQFTQAEDEFLSQYFKLYFAKLFEAPEKDDSKPDYSLGAESTAAKMAAMHKVDFMENICHWHKFRIPGRRRKEVLEKYWRLRLKKHAHAADDFFTLANEADGWQQDLDVFLRKLQADGQDLRRNISFRGSKEDLKSKLGRVVSWWDLPRDSALALISAAAKSLANEDPFQDHPANNDVLAKVLGPSRTNSKAGRPNSKIALPQGMQYAVSREENKKPAVQKRGASSAETLLEEAMGKADEISEEESEQDLEDLFEGFTPRLKDAIDEEREASEPDLARALEDLENVAGPREKVGFLRRDSKGRTHKQRGHEEPLVQNIKLRRPSALTAAAKLHGRGAHSQ